MNMNNIFAAIEKYEKLDDDVILISGIASSEAMDNQNEIVNAEAMKAAIPDYLSLGGTGALREMHQSKAAGSVFKAEVMDDGRTHIEARVVDKEACKKIEQGVYKGFSIGGKVLKKEGNIITKVKLTEISLVDRPCNPEALFNMYKCDDIEIEDAGDIEKIAERKEVNPKEGQSKYGDVKFADEKNKKYPINTESHIRAAWNYIHQKRNAAKYSAADAASIKSKIVAAWKKVIGGEPPAAEAKKYDSQIAISQAMGLNHIQRLSCLIQDLVCLQECMEYEEEMEMDKSPLPEDLTMAISNLYDILVRMAQEEHAEFNDHKDEIKMSDNTKDLSKYDAQDAKDAQDGVKATSATPQQSPKFDDVTSKVNSEQSEQLKPKEINDLFASVDAIKRRLIERGYIDNAELEKPTSVAWGEKSDKSDDLKKMLSEFKDQMTDISDRLTKIEESPAPTKGTLKNVSDSYSVISKGSDLDGKELQKVDRSSFTNMKLEEREYTAMDVIKSIHAGKI